MKTNKNLALLAEAPVKKALLKMGIPIMIAMMISALYNLVDTYFVGKLGTAQQAAVSAVYPIGLFMLGVGLFFGYGGGSYISRLLGKKDNKEADRCASTTLLIAIITAIVLVLLMLLFLDPILSILGCKNEVLPFAKEYAVPFILGLVINVFNCTMSNIATCEGAPMYSMTSMLIGGVANMILDSIFILLLGMGVKGAAYATILGRLLSLCNYLYFILAKKSGLNYSLKNIHFSSTMIKELFVVGIPAMFYQILCSVSIAITDKVASNYSTDAIAACGIVSRIASLAMMMVMGFLKGYQTFVGYNFGAKNYDRVKESTKTALIWSTIYSVIFSAIMIFLCKQLVLAFNKDSADVLAIGMKALILNGITCLTLGFQMVYSSKFMGLGKGIQSGLICIGRQGFFFIPVIFICSSLWGLDGVIYSQPIADILSFILVVILAYRNHNEEKNLMVQTKELAVS